MKKLLVALILVLFIVAISLAFFRVGMLPEQEALNVTQIVETETPAARRISQKRDVAKEFLQGTIGELGIVAQISPTTKKINLEGRAVDTAGYSVFIPRDTNLMSYFTVFDNDWKNSGDATFSSQLGYINERLICIDFLRTIAPNNDFSKCDSGNTCTTTREVFCANL